MHRGFSKLIGSNDRIVNLSSRKLTEDEITLLGLGLKFIQVPSKKCFSGAVDSSLLDIEATFGKYIWSKSNVMSRAQGDTMVKLLNYIKLKLQKIYCRSDSSQSKFSQRLRMALESLREDRNIIIAKADKGDAVVVPSPRRGVGHTIDKCIITCTELFFAATV